MSKQELAENVVSKMLADDPFSRWLGIEMLGAAPGRVVLQMKVREQMLNGLGVCHGGVTFSFADSALAFASNSHGKVSLLLKATMAYPARVLAGDLLKAVAEEETLNDKIGIYRIIVSKNDGEKVGIFHGTVYRTQKDHFEEEK
jgi:acyl-CoA thioesterase